MTARLTIITVCLNEKDGIERTVASVLDQSQRDQLQYIVVDGGSDDGTLDYLRQYESEIDVLISEKDDGIYDAMNKGAQHAKGTYLLFLNGGDYLANDDVVRAFAACSPKADIVHGFLTDPSDNVIKALSGVYVPVYLRTRTLPHQASFIDRELFDSMGGYDVSFRIAGDYDFFVRAILENRASTQYVHQHVAVFNLDGVARHTPDVRQAEKDRIQSRIPKLTLQERATAAWTRILSRFRNN